MNYNINRMKYNKLGEKGFTKGRGEGKMINEQSSEGERANFYKNSGIYYILP